MHVRMSGPEGPLAENDNEAITDRALFFSVFLAMARFIVGDELGNLKTLRYALGKEGDAPQLKTIHQGSAEGSTRTVQALAVNTPDNETIVRSQPSVVPGH